MEQNSRLKSSETLGAELKLKTDSDNNYRLMGVMAILGMSGVAAVAAGVITSYVAKKKNKELLKELGKEIPPQVLLESPYSLAFRALAWGTVWAVGGCSLIAFGIWKWYGFKDLQDLRTRMRSRIKKSTDPRTEFKDLRELFNYLNEESNKSSKRT